MAAKLQNQVRFIAKYCIKDYNSTVSKIELPFLLDSSDSTNKIIFTQADYARVRIENSDFYKIMEALILTHTFIFLGAGLNDPDIKLLFENYATTFHVSKNHYFVIPNNTYSDLELQVYKETMHLDFIKYDPADNHKELSEGLKELDAKVEDKKEDVKDKLWW